MARSPQFGLNATETGPDPVSALAATVWVTGVSWPLAAATVNSDSVSES